MRAVRDEQVPTVVKGKALRIKQQSLLQGAEIADPGRARHRFNRESRWLSALLLRVTALTGQTISHSRIVERFDEGRMRAVCKPDDTQPAGGAGKQAVTAC